MPEFANTFCCYDLHLKGRDEQTVGSYHFILLKPNQPYRNQNISSTKELKVLSLTIFIYTSGGNCHSLATVAMKGFFVFLRCMQKKRTHTMLAEMAEKSICEEETREGMDDNWIHCRFSAATMLRMVVTVGRIRKLGKTITFQICQNYF